jgi:hypothetical protein
MKVTNIFQHYFILIQHSIDLIFLFADLDCVSYKLLIGRQFISQSRFMLNSTVTIVKVRKVGENKFLNKKFFKREQCYVIQSLSRPRLRLSFRTQRLNRIGQQQVR